MARSRNLNGYISVLETGCKLDSRSRQRFLGVSIRQVADDCAIEQSINIIIISIMLGKGGVGGSCG